MISSVSIVLVIILDAELAQATSSDVNELIDKGVSLDDLGKSQEAITYFDKALAIDPNYVSALNNKGIALYDMGKSQEAITYYDKALAIDPKHVNALINKGLALDHLGQYRQAITYYDKVLAIDPTNDDALNNKAVAEANLTPDFKPVFYNGINFNHGGYVLVTKSISNDASSPDVKTPFDRALELKPDDTKILVNKGKFLADKLGNYEVAIAFFDKALKIDFNYVPALVNKGGCLEKLGSHEGAQELFDKAKQLDPTYENKFITAPPKSSNALPSPI